MCIDLRANRALLNNPNKQIVNEALDALFELWLGFSDDPNFDAELNKMHMEHPTLREDFIVRINALSFSEKEKAVLLTKKINSLFPSESLQTTQINKKTDEKQPDLSRKPGEVEERAKKNVHPSQPEFALSRSAAKWVTLLFSLAILTGGLSAGSDFSGGIILSVLLIIAAIMVLYCKLLK